MISKLCHRLDGSIAEPPLLYDCASCIAHIMNKPDDDAILFVRFTFSQEKLRCTAFWIVNLQVNHT